MSVCMSVCHIHVLFFRILFLFLRLLFFHILFLPISHTTIFSQHTTFSPTFSFFTASCTAYLIHITYFTHHSNSLVTLLSFVFLTSFFLFGVLFSFTVLKKRKPMESLLLLKLKTTYACLSYITEHSVLSQKTSLYINLLYTSCVGISVRICSVLFCEV